MLESHHMHRQEGLNAPENLPVNKPVRYGVHGLGVLFRFRGLCGKGAANCCINFSSSEICLRSVFLPIAIAAL